jgi:hypothetical protein
VGIMSHVKSGKVVGTFEKETFIFKIEWKKYESAKQSFIIQHSVDLT